ncbi:MAG TPA: MJ1255/VC2487 family glycosyltransferase [Polyangia bacterium]|nr:MJ1255/VC2487 family glycosyltransferase [Polyangia bacterium]
MKILYGVPGEGMGHATRSRVILDHLATRRHQVKIVVSGRAHGYLKKLFPDVEEIRGLHLAYGGNTLDRSRTVYEFFRDAPDDLADNIEKYFQIARSYRPDCVISDFESFAYLYGRRHRIPILSIDNMQIINRCQIPDDLVPARERANFRMTRGVVKAKLPGCHHYLITTFFFPKLRKPRTTLYPPILRREILEARARASRRAHVLVYQTSATNLELLDVLARLAPTEFRVYGYRRHEDRGNVQLKDFSEMGFVRDLATCWAVIAGGGFSLMGEAVYLGKPMLSVPLEKQFEQILNALYLARLGYGEYHKRIDEPTVRRFLERADGYAENLKAHQQDGNQLILGAVDRLLDEIGSARRAARAR